MKSIVYLIPIACTAIFGFNASVQAQTPLADEKQTVTHFWSFANCVTQRDRWRVEQILSNAEDLVKNAEMTERLAKKNNGCLPDGSKMQFSGPLFRTALAGALLHRKYRHEGVPDYSPVQNLYSVTSVPENTDASVVRDIALKQFSECVSRMAPLKILELFGARPFSNRENEVFESLQPEMGHCLPVSEGKQFGFTRLQLRTLLAEVAYELDLELVSKMEIVEQPEAQN